MDWVADGFLLKKNKEKSKEYKYSKTSIRLSLVKYTLHTDILNRPLCIEYKMFSLKTVERDFINTHTSLGTGIAQWLERRTRD